MLNDVTSKYSEDITSVKEFADSLYNDNFASHFSKVNEIYKRMNSSVTSVTDSELEYILVNFPMELIAVSEKLNSIRLKYEVIKLKNKQTSRELRRSLSDQASEMGMNKSEISSYVSACLAEHMIEFDVMAKAYESVMSRVSSEITFSKELIMGSKKVWDSRRNSENVNPVDPVELPEYDPSTTSNRYNTYIK